MDGPHQTNGLKNLTAWICNKLFKASILAAIQLAMVTLSLERSPAGQQIERSDVPMFTLDHELHFMPSSTSRSPLLPDRRTPMHVLGKTVTISLRLSEYIHGETTAHDKNYT